MYHNSQCYCICECVPLSDDDLYYCVLRERTSNIQNVARHMGHGAVPDIHVSIWCWSWRAEYHLLMHDMHHMGRQKHCLHCEMCVRVWGGGVGDVGVGVWCTCAHHDYTCMVRQYLYHNCYTLTWSLSHCLLSFISGLAWRQPTHGSRGCRESHMTTQWAHMSNKVCRVIQSCVGWCHVTWQYKDNEVTWCPVIIQQLTGDPAGWVYTPFLDTWSLNATINLSATDWWMTTERATLMGDKSLSDSWEYWREFSRITACECVCACVCVCVHVHVCIICQ